MTIPIRGDAPRPLALPPPFVGLGHDFIAVRQRAELLGAIDVVFEAARVIPETFSESFEHVVSGFRLLLMQGRETRGR